MPPTIKTESETIDIFMILPASKNTGNWALLEIRDWTLFYLLKQRRLYDQIQSRDKKTVLADAQSLSGQYGRRSEGLVSGLPAAVLKHRPAPFFHVFL